MNDLTKDSAPKLDVKKASGIEKDFNIQQVDPFARALASLLVWREGGGESGWRVHERYRDLFACLTPRQIKSFFRERLLAVRSEDDEHPSVLFLQQLFHPVWKLWRNETDNFRALACAAEAALKLSSGPDERRIRQHGKLTALASDFFFVQFQAISGRSSTLGNDDVLACWPEKSEERALLLNLLCTISMEIAPAGSATTESFDQWVAEHLGKRPAGASVADKVSSFQDITLERFQLGDKGVLQWVADYADRFLESHRSYFDATAATSLSNLAVLIDDASGFEPQCDHLFSLAVDLARPGSRIPFFYIEFLLDVMMEEARRARLAPDDPEGNGLRERARRILDRIPDEGIEAKDHFYRNLLGFRLDVHEERDIKERMSEIWKLVRHHASTLISGGREPSSRLDDLLDAVVGKQGARLGIKTPLEAVVWAAQVRVSRTGWPMALQLANTLVGESSTASREETLGLRMNAALLADGEFLQTGDVQRLGAIWSQSGAILALRLGATGKSRVALAFLASLVYGVWAKTHERMETAWKRVGEGNGVPSAEGWRKLLDKEQGSLLNRLEKNPYDADAAAAIRDAVFGREEYGLIDDPEVLVHEMGWDRRNFEWPDAADFGERVAALLKEVEFDGTTARG